MMLECELVKDVTLDCELDTGEAKSQSKTVTPTAEPQTVYPDSGYLLSSVRLTEPLSQEKTVTSAVNQQTVVPDEGYLLSSVTVDGMPTETASVTPTEQTQTVTPSEGKLLSEVTVEPIPSQYSDTSDATATAADINLGKTAYIAGGEVVGTNDYIKPTKGVIFTDWDSDGYPHKAVITGMTTVPNYYLYRGQNGQINQNIERIEVNEGVTTIGMGAFMNISATEIVIPTTVTQLSDNCVNNTRITELIVPNTNSVSIGYIRAPIVKLEISGDCRIGYSLYGMGTQFKQFICHGQILAWIRPFDRDVPVELYDFSGCDTIFALGDVTHLRHADGCVIRVKTSLLNDWKNTAVWADLPTDPNVSGYVVWEGV